MHSGILGCPKSTKTSSRCILDKTGGACTHPGIWTVLGWMFTLNWNHTWAATDDVSQEHKYREERRLRKAPKTKHGNGQIQDGDGQTAKLKASKLQSTNQWVMSQWCQHNCLLSPLFINEMQMNI